MHDGGSKRILLIEDNMDDEALTLRAIRKHDPSISVFVARDGSQALQVICQLTSNVEDYPSLILLDLRLPKVSGTDVLRIAKAHPVRERIPVVILTASEDPSSEAECFDLGADGFIRKPMDHSAYCEALEPVLNRWVVLSGSAGAAISVM